MHSFPLEMKFHKGIGRPEIYLKLSCVNIVFFPFARLHVRRMYFVEEKLISCVLSWTGPPVLVKENLVIYQVMLPALS